MEEALDFAINPEKRRPGAGIREIQTDPSRVAVLIVPTDEEREIAEQTVTYVQKAATEG